MKKLLIVDDEEEIVTFLRDYFSAKGIYTVLTATSKEGAVQALHAEQPDLMLLDLKLHHQLEGYEILELAKQISSNTKVIVISAVEERGAIDKALKLGAVNYITKPVSLEYLENEVMEKLKAAAEGE